MATINFLIPDAKLQKVIDAMVWSFPIPLDKNREPMFTEAQWAKESIRRYIIDRVHKKALSDARSAVSIEKDDELVQ